jgi:hypothetical protein
MKLEQLRPNLGELPVEEAFTLFKKYCEKRSTDITQLIVKPKEVTTKKKTTRKRDEISVTQEQFNVLKKLGLV